MLWRNRNKINNAVPMSIPRPANQTVINHAPSYAGMLAIGFLCGLILLFIGWHFLLYVVEEMGFKKPVKVVGEIFFGGAGLLLLACVAYLALTKPLKMYFDYKVQIEQIKGQNAEKYALLASRPMPGESRLTDDSAQFAGLLRVVMGDAYRHLAEAGQYSSRNDKRPWSRRGSAGLTLPGFDKPITEAMASKIRPWLFERGVIKREQINTERYPTYAHFEALLEKEFYTPVQVNPALPPGYPSPTLLPGRYEHIE